MSTEDGGSERCPGLNPTSAPYEALWLLLGNKRGPRSRWIATHRVPTLERMEITVSYAAFAGESSPWLGGTGRLGGIRTA